MQLRRSEGHKTSNKLSRRVCFSSFRRTRPPKAHIVQSPPSAWAWLPSFESTSATFPGSCGSPDTTWVAASLKETDCGICPQSAVLQGYPKDVCSSRWVLFGCWWFRSNVCARWRFLCGWVPSIYDLPRTRICGGWCGEGQYGKGRPGRVGVACWLWSFYIISESEDCHSE